MATMRIFSLDGKPKASATEELDNLHFVAPTRGPGQYPPTNSQEYEPCA